MNQTHEIWSTGKPVEVETPRFCLRSLRRGDATEAYVSWWNDKNIQQAFNALPRSWSKANAEKHIAGFNNRTNFHLGIFYKKTSDMVGFFTIRLTQDKSAATDTICVGNRDYRRRGAALETYRAMNDFQFRVLGVYKLIAKVFGSNTASLKLHEKLGFQLEAVKRQSLKRVTGGRSDLYIFGLLREEWDAKAQAERNPSREWEG